MRILYIAAGIPVPGTLGGSTHAYEVARGLAARGHDVHLIAAAYEAGLTGWRPRDLRVPQAQPLDGFTLYQQNLPKALSLPAVPAIETIARRIRPDLIIERYYNLAGAGMIVAQRLGIPTLLEVNALIVDPPQVRKRRLDDACGGPLRRWAEQQCRWADRIITPLHTTVPASIAREKIVELPWGADVERFGPRQPHSGPPVVVFLGSFRSWHGVTDAVRAALLLIERGHDYRFRLIGDGPERAAAEALAAPHADRFEFVGALPYRAVPAALADADLGVAPFNTAAHPALQHAGFFWSPLKIYEYMAARLPVVTADITPLNQVIREGSEGALFREGDIGSLADAISRVLSNTDAARQMGERARERVTAHYSWQQHCADIERIALSLVDGRASV
jgi:glycosyltransferase involved in cell wall biosynthesis